MAPSGDQHTQGPYREQEYAGDRATEVHRTQQRMPDEDRSTRAEIESGIATRQAEQLAPAVRMGDDRAIGAPPNWEAMTSTQLYAAATQANDPDTAENLGRAFNSGGNKLADAANRLLDAVGKLDAAWSGVAADSAKGALTPLASATGAAGVAAQLMGAQMSRQAAAASEVRKLPPPQEFDAQAELRSALANPNPVAGLADMKTKADEAKAVKQEQVAYLNAYTEAMLGVDGATPSFIEPTTGITGGDGGHAPITGGSVDYAGPPGGTGEIGGDPDQGTSTGTPHAPGTGAFAPGMGFAPDGGGDQTGGQEVTPLPGFPPGGGTGSSGYTPTAPAPSAPAPGVPAGGAPAAGAGGFGGGFGSFGPGAPGQPGRGGIAPGSAPGAGSGARPGGAGTPGVAGEPAGAAGRGAAGAGRAGAGMGMGAGGAGGRKAEEDDEHERPAYLVEGDPEGTFGSNEMTAPPVIGED